MKKAPSFLKEPFDGKDEITLVPFSGIQIVDFSFDLGAMNFRPRRFIERTVEEVGEHMVRALIPLSGNDDKDREIIDAQKMDDEEYSTKAHSALETFLGKWVPAPVFRIRPGRGIGGAEQYDPGPSTWARLRVTEMPAQNDKAGPTHRFQLAFDTNLVKNADHSSYTTPTFKDSADESEFRFVHEPQNVGWFLRRPEQQSDGQVIDLQKWVSEWLEELFIETLQSKRPNRAFSSDDLSYKFEHWARYLTLIELLAETRIPKIRLLDIVSPDERYRPIDVDLVLDVGNSRTCGILIESISDEAVNLNNSYALEVRDLSRPELSYDTLVESRVEFAEARFGKDHIARRSGRRNAFLWPSFVRIGHEAMAMVRREDGTETASGLSSPKRYLWDTEPVGQDWRFQDSGSNQSLPLIARSAFRFLNERGDVIRQIEMEERRRLRKRGETSTEPALRPRFSRSSLYGFMIGELVCHALVQINDPAGRARRRQADLPRRLRRIILTLPSATPVQEQAIIRSRAEGALKLIWAIVDVDEAAAPTCAKPELVVEWDEASCTQLVYLYTEITQKFAGRIGGYLELKGKPRKLPEGGPEQPSLRVACIDIGGGTTDLMITTYYGEADQVFHPRQNFREGFRIAGDDLVRDVISSIVLPHLRDSIELAGGRHVTERLKVLFSEGGNKDEQENQLRRQFGLRVLAPLAIELLDRSENLKETDSLSIEAGEVLGWRNNDSDQISGSRNEESSDGDGDETRRLSIPHRLVAFLEDAAREVGSDSWKLSDFRIDVQRSALDGCVFNVFQKAVGNLMEAINDLDTDLILLTGRPSRLPAVRTLVREAMAVPPNRLISMHRYRVGGWYPFRDQVTNAVGDPKSTVAVGGMLCALSSSRITNFRFRSDELRMTSTAKYIGQMSINGQILDSDIILKDVDLDNQAAGDEEATVNLFARMYIGSRQLPLERWTTTPLYKLELANTAAERRPPPLTVVLRREQADVEPETNEAHNRAEAMKEAFTIDTVEDAEGARCKPSDVRLRFQTLGFDESYWLDTGTFNFG